MGHTPVPPVPPVPPSTVASEDGSPAWAVPGLRPPSALSARLTAGTAGGWAGGWAGGLVPKAAELFADFAAGAEGATPTGQVVAMRTLIDQYEGLWLAAASELESSGAIAEAGFGSLASWLRHT